MSTPTARAVKRAIRKRDREWRAAIEEACTILRQQLHGATEHNADQWRQCISYFDDLAEGIQSGAIGIGGKAQ